MPSAGIGSRVIGLGFGGARVPTLISNTDFTDVAALEAFASSNPALLLNNAGAFSTAFVAGDLYNYQGSEGIYVVGQWVDATPSGLTPEMTRDIESIAALSPAIVPIASANGLIDSIATQPNEDIIMVDGELGITRTTLRVGDNLTIGEDGAAVIIADMIDNTRSLPCGTLINDDGSTGVNAAIRRDQLQEQVIQALDDETRLGQWVAHLPITASRIIKSLRVRFAQVATGVRFTMRQAANQSQTDGAILYQSHTDTAWNNGGGFTLTASPEGGPTTFEIALENSAKVIDGEFVYLVVEQNAQGTGSIEFRGSTLDIAGVTQFYAYLEQTFLIETLDELALKSDIPTIERSRTIELDATYTAQASDFIDVDHVFYRFNNTGQVDFNIPISIVPNNISLSVKEVGTGGATHRVLVVAQGGLIDNESDHLLDAEEAILIHKGTSNSRLDIIADYEPTTGQNNYVTGGAFANNLISLNRVGLSSTQVPLDLNDVDNAVSGLPVSHTFSLVENDNTQQTIDFGVQPLQWTALNGGKMGLRFQLHTSQQGGFVPELLSLELDYGTLSFTFPLNGYEIDEDSLVELAITDTDYSAILNSSPTVTLIVNFRGYAYTGRFEFKELYNRETSLIHNDVEQIADNSAGQVLHQLLPLIEADEANIANLQSAINALIQRVNDLPQSIPPSVLSWLINDVNINETTTPVLDPSQYNMMLASDQTQSVFVDANQVDAGGNLTSGAIKGLTVRGQNMFELILSGYADGDAIVSANDAVTTTTDLIKRSGNNVVAIKYIPAHGGGSRTVTEYPLPPNQFHHEWYRILLSTGAPTFNPVASELAFTQNVPSVSSTLNIQVRTVANGIAGAITTRTLTGVGGSSNVSDSFSLAVGSESIDIQTRWDAARQTIYVSGNPHISSGGLAIVDIEVGVSYDETETAPVTPESTQEIAIARYIENTTLVMLLEPSIARVDSNTATMIIHTPTANVNTDYGFNALFGTADDGDLTVIGASGQPSSWYNWEKFTPSEQVLTQISDRMTLPYLGWFVQNYDHNTVAQIGTQVEVLDSSDDKVLAGQELIQIAPNGDRYSIGVDNNGNRTSTKM